MSVIIGFWSVQALAQKGDPKSYTLVFYNVENLFDTIDNPHCSDNEFLPGSKNPWTAERYQRKLENIARVLEATDSMFLPVLIGFSEIENRSVLEDLLAVPVLSRGQYKIIHEESSDPRCIDVALAYRPDVFTEISHTLIPVYYHDSARESARECLYVCGKIGKRDSVHIIVNHWKSRSGGAEQTEAKRITYAKTIRHWVDSIFRKSPNAYILLMGDFNDGPNDASVREFLITDQTGSVVNSRILLNLTAALADSGRGTHYYKSWELFDQMIASPSLVKNKKKGLKISGQAVIFSREWMLYKNNKGLMVPNRTFASGQYFGGYSDHLPVTARLWILR
jgi:predicted extracellular nuclease